MNNRYIIKTIKQAFDKGEEPKTQVDYYRVGKVLGKGAFGKVNLAKHKLAKKLVAIKSINKEFIQEDT